MHSLSKILLLFIVIVWLVVAIIFIIFATILAKLR